jgi:hypothetical protein
MEDSPMVWSFLCVCVFVCMRALVRVCVSGCERARVCLCVCVSMSVCVRVFALLCVDLSVYLFVSLSLLVVFVFVLYVSVCLCVSIFCFPMSICVCFVANHSDRVLCSPPWRRQLVNCDRVKESLRDSQWWPYYSHQEQPLQRVVPFSYLSFFIQHAWIVILKLLNHFTVHAAYKKLYLLGHDFSFLIFEFSCIRIS